MTTATQIGQTARDRADFCRCFKAGAAVFLHDDGIVAHYICRNTSTAAHIPGRTLMTAGQQEPIPPPRKKPAKKYGSFGDANLEAQAVPDRRLWDLAQALGMVASPYPQRSAFQTPAINSTLAPCAAQVPRWFLLGQTAFEIRHQRLDDLTGVELNGDNSRRGTHAQRQRLSAISRTYDIFRD